MGDYETDRARGDKVMRDVVWVLKTACNWETEPASEYLDLNEATDLVANGCWHVAVRSRSLKQYYGDYGNEFTIRSRRASGVETELAKIEKGFGDWLFYGFVEGWQHQYFRIINLMAFREAIRMFGVGWFSMGGEIPNRDGTTFFHAFDVRRFQKPWRFPIVFREGAC